MSTFLRPGFGLTCIGSFYVLELGQPVEIESKGRRLRIVVDQGGKLDMLKPYAEYLKVPPEEIVHIDWPQ